MATITYSDIKKEVRKHLAIIGKHRANPKGGTLFATTDLTTIETDVIPTFIVGATQMIAATLSPILASYSTDSNSLSFEIDASRWGTALPESFADSVRSYIVAYVTSAVLSMVLPDTAQKYDTEAKNLLAALTNIAYTKQTPAASTADYSNVSGGMYNDDGTEFNKTTVIPDKDGPEKKEKTDEE